MQQNTKTCIVDCFTPSNWPKLFLALILMNLHICRCLWSSPPSRSFQQRRLHSISRLTQAPCALSEPLTRASSCCSQSRSSPSTLYGTSLTYVATRTFTNALNVPFCQEIAQIYLWMCTGTFVLKTRWMNVCLCRYTASYLCRSCLDTCMTLKTLSHILASLCRCQSQR